MGPFSALRLIIASAMFAFAAGDHIAEVTVPANLLSLVKENENDYHN